MSTQASDDLGFQAVLSERNGKYYLRIPELSIVVSDTDIRSALDRLAAEKQAIFERAKEAGVLDELPRPRQSSWRRAAPPAVGWGLGPFLLKMVIVTIAIVGTALPLARSVKSGIREAVAEATSGLAGEREFWTSLENSLYEAADPSHELSPEQMEKLIASLRVMVNRIKPFSDELWPLFDESECGR